MNETLIKFCNKFVLVVDFLKMNSVILKFSSFLLKEFQYTYTLFKLYSHTSCEKHHLRAINIPMLIIQ